MNPLVTVIVPVYQSKEYLSGCLDSVIEQTYTLLEIIVVDDGSTDGSSEICDEYSLKDNRIKVIHQKNGGLSSARNAGIDICSGEYITFVDSDDIIADCMISSMVNMAQKEHADIVKIGVIRKYAYSECKPVEKKYEVFSNKTILHKIYSTNSQTICGCGKLFKKSVIGNIRFPVGKYYEDEFFVPKVYARSKKVVMSDSEYYFYMQRDNDSIMRGKINDKKVEDSLWITEERIESFRKLNDNSLVIKAVSDYYYKIQVLYKVSIENGLTNCIELLRVKKKEFKREHLMIYACIKVKQLLYKIFKFLKGSH